MNLLFHLLFAYLQNAKSWFGICQKNYKNTYNNGSKKCAMQCKYLCESLDKDSDTFFFLFINRLLL